ncbi:MAG: hypothetical protein ACXQTF_02080 [Candidatus Hecatellaceae archaeon]
MVKVKSEGEGLSIEQEVDEQTANVIIGLIFGLRKTRGRRPADVQGGKRAHKKTASGIQG